jgi:arabinose operon protein AraL
LEGGNIPDCAATIGLIERTPGKKVETIAGKPSGIMIRVALGTQDLTPYDCLLLGERRETDRVRGKKAGMATALFLRE